MCKIQENISLTFIAKRYNISIFSVQRILDKCYSDLYLYQETYYCQSFKCKLSSKKGRLSFREELRIRY